MHLLQESIKQLQDEIRTINEAQGVFSTFSDWLCMAQENFRTAAVSIDLVDRVAMERKMKKLEVQEPWAGPQGVLWEGGHRGAPINGVITSSPVGLVLMR